MLNFRGKYSELVLNLLVAAAVSLVVNFAYLLLMIVDLRSESQTQNNPRETFLERRETGRLTVSPDGHGYITYAQGDSVYVPMQRIRRMRLADGDSLEVSLAAPRRPGAHPMMAEIVARNGEEFDYGAVFNRPSAATDMTVNLLYYFALSFVVLSILIMRCGSYSAARFTRRCVWAGLAVAGLYFFAPVPEWHSGSFVMNFTVSGRSMLDPMLLLRCSFAVVVSILYARIYQLISQRQQVVVENEQLKNENLTTRYNMLVGQINPHFFFNSLNSLAMLVREKQDEKALTYIDQLSYTFRYILQNGQNTLITLDEELKFAEAYGYLFKIRYADKLFFDIEIDEEYRSWRLPVLTLQPLIGNAVKHNTITRNMPMHVSIRTEQGMLVVSNPKRPKLEAEPSTGIGLENLSNRWQLITGLPIEIVDTEAEFVVRMPLQKPDRA